MAAPETTGLQLFFLSPSGERLGILSDKNESGKLLQFKLSTTKMGGVESFSFNVARDNPLPLSRNTEVYVYVDGVLWFNGYIDDIPEPDQDNPVLNIKGLGFYKRLEKKIINRTYTAQTLDFIAKDLLNNELDFEVGVNYDVTKVELPTLTGISIEFKDKTILKCIDDLMLIANYDYATAKYRYFVDTDKDFNIVEYGDTIEKGLFEGYQFQSPVVKKESGRIRNKILTYRTTLADDSEVEYVATVEDTASQDKEGIFESKLIVPSYVDNVTVQNMASFLIERNKTPQKTISVSDLIATEILPFELYSISNRRLKYWELLNDCDSLDGWDLTNLDTAAVSLSNTHILTGRQSIKVVCNLSDGEYIEYTLDEKVPLPQYVRVYTYFDSTPLHIRFDYFDATGNSTSINLGTTTEPFIVNEDVSTESQLSIDSFGDEQEFYVDSTTEVTVNQWLVLKEMVGDDTNVDNFQVNLTAGGANEDFEVNIDADTTEILEVRTDSQAALLEIKKVRVTILTDAAGTFYLDRLDCQADIYKRSKLLLESAEYNLSNTRRTINADFGEKIDNIVDAIKEQVKDGDTALAVMSKQ